MPIKTLQLPQLAIEDDVLRLSLAIKLLEDGQISLGKAAELSGYTERTFAEILLKKGIAPVRYEGKEIEKEIENL